MAVEMKLVDIQFDTTVRVRLAATAVDTAEYVFMYTKAVATHIDANHGQLDMGFCPSVCATEKVDRDSYVGLKRVWMRQVGVSLGGAWWYRMAPIETSLLGMCVELHWM